VGTEYIDDIIADFKQSFAASTAAGADKKAQEDAIPADRGIVPEAEAGPVV
jgi:ribosomal protein L12E/L44/L45/RPP1/RPP2